MRNPLCMLYCEAILKRGGGARVATIAETQKIVRFRTEKPHAGDYERDGLRFSNFLRFRSGNCQIFQKMIFQKLETS